MQTETYQISQLQGARLAAIQVGGHHIRGARIEQSRQLGAHEWSQQYAERESRCVYFVTKGVTHFHPIETLLPRSSVQVETRDITSR